MMQAVAGVELLPQQESQLILTPVSVGNQEVEMKMIVLSLVVAIFFSSLTGCSSPKPEEIIGEWIPAGDSPKIIKNPALSKPIYLTEQPYIIFNPEGTFVLEHFPELLIGLHNSTRIISGKGNWYIDKYQGSDVVRLRFTEGISLETFIKISKGIKNITLHCWTQEPGVGRFNFVKKPAKKE